MVKLTAELIEQAAQYTNAVRDRELDLRGESGEARAVRGVAAGPRPAACARAGPKGGGLRQQRPGAGLAAVAEGPALRLLARPPW